MEEEKIVCKYCGTVYDAAQEHCPVCHDLLDYSDNYDGDHFDFDERDPEDEAPVSAAPPRHRGGKIAALIVLLLLFIGFTGYILYSFELIPFLPTPSERIAESLRCTSVQLDASELTFTELGATQVLTATAAPTNTRDTVTFSSEDESIATVSTDGTVTAVAEGTTRINVVCGEKTAACTVICQPEPEEPEPEEQEPAASQPLTISATDISFFASGENTVLTLTGGSGTDAEWVSSAPAVASVDSSGYVVAKTPGNATITATVGNETVCCVVRCNFAG